MELKRSAAIRSMHHFSSVLLNNIPHLLQGKKRLCDKIEVKTGSLPLGQWRAPHFTKIQLMNIKMIEGKVN